MVAAHRRSGLLVAGNAMVVGLLALHSLDHILRQEAAVPAEAAVAGLAGLGAAVVSLALALRLRQV